MFTYILYIQFKKSCSLTQAKIDMTLKFVIAFKNQYTLNSLMSVSKLDFVSAQTRSRLIKIISYLSKNNFLNTYQPKLYEDQVDIDIPISRGRRAPL